MPASARLLSPLPHHPPRIHPPLRHFPLRHVSLRSSPSSSSSLLPRTPVLRRPASSSTSTATPSPSPPRNKSRTAAAIALVSTLSGLTYYYYYYAARPGSLNPDTFTAYTLTSITPVAVGETRTSIFTLSPPAGTSASASPLFSPNVVQSVQLKQPELQIARHYTPLPDSAASPSPSPSSPPSTPSPTPGGGDIRLLVKLEPGGEVSKHVFSLPLHSPVELRGPFTEYVLPEPGPGRGTRLLFLAGGTGIAPALQCAEKVLSRRGGEGNDVVTVFWAVRRREETEGAMRELVEALKRRFSGEGAGEGGGGEGDGGGGRLRIEVFVDGEGGLKMDRVERELRAVAGGGKGTHAARELVVSGPEGFIRYWVGEKKFVAGREEQGPLGGVVGELARRGKVKGEVNVWKL